MESTVARSTFVGKSHVITFAPTAIANAATGEEYRHVDICREPNGSVLLLSRSNPNPARHDQDDEIVNAVSIPASLAAAVLAIFGVA